MAAPTRNVFLALTGNTGTAAYTPSIATLRTGCTVGDYICLFLAVDGNPTLSLSAQSTTDGWIIVRQDADATAACKGAILRYIVGADGVAPDPTINLTASEAITGHGLRIRPSSGTTLQLIAATQAQGSSTNPDPASITNSTGATRDILYMAFWMGDGVVLSTVAPTNFANHQSHSISNAANGSSIGSADRTVAAVTNTTAQDPAVFTRATEQWVAYTTAAYEVVPTAVSGSPIATPSPAIDSPGITQNHNVSAAAVATPAPSLGSPAITQVHSLTGTVLATPAPQIASPAVGQTHVLSAAPLATPAPEVALGTVTVTHALTGLAVETPAPEVGLATMGQTHAISTLAVETPAPVIGTPAIGQTHQLVALPLETSGPAISEGVLSQVHGLGTLDVATGPPSIGSPAISQTHVLAADALATPIPEVGTPAASQTGETYEVTGLPVSTPAPVIAGSAITQTHAFDAPGIATPTPQIDVQAIGQVHLIPGLPAATPAPQLGQPVMGQSHGLTAMPVETPPPEIGTPGITNEAVVDQAPTVSRLRAGLNTASTARLLSSYSRLRQEGAPMPSHRWGAKDPDEVINYTHDWSALLLNGDEVVGDPEAVVESCDAVVDLTEMKTATVQRVRISGGTAGRCKITIAINTVQGNYWQEGIVLPIREQ